MLQYFLTPILLLLLFFVNNFWSWWENEKSSQGLDIFLYFQALCIYLSHQDSFLMVRQDPSLTCTYSKNYYKLKKDTIYKFQINLLD